MPNPLGKAKCKAHSTRTGKPCQAYAMHGGVVCAKHGGTAPQVKAAAARRLVLAEALAAEDRRHPWEILEEALHVAYVVMKDTIQQNQGKTLTPKILTDLVTAIDRAHRMAKVNLDAGIDQRRLHLAETQAGQMHQVFTRVLAKLSLTPEQRALVPDLLRREVEAVIRPGQDARSLTEGAGEGRKGDGKRPKLLILEGRAVEHPSPQ